MDDALSTHLTIFYTAATGISSWLHKDLRDVGDKGLEVDTTDTAISGQFQSMRKPRCGNGGNLAVLFTKSK